MISEPVQIAVIAAAFPTIGIIVSSYFSYKANKKTETKLDKADVKLDEIHTLTNDSASKATAKIDELHKEVNKLQAIISKG